MKILDKDHLLVTLDFETFYDKGYSLSAMNTFTYVADERFSIHGVGIKIDDQPTRWFNDTIAALAHIDECNTDSLPIALLCHNTYFDGWILHHHFDWHADLYLDTMCMSRGLFPASSASLEKLCERLWPNDPKMRKGKELVQFKGVTAEQLHSTPAALKTMIRYCHQDVDLTHAAFLRMEQHYPDPELRLIDLTLRMMCEPLVRIDVPRVHACLSGAIEHRNRLIRESGYAESTLSSNTKFEALIRNLGLPVPLKDSPTAKEADGTTPKKIAALGKADLGFQELRRAFTQFEHIWQGRIAAKSVGEITRAERFIATADQCDGYMPVPLIYYSAHTGRYGGGEKLNLQNLGRTSELRRSLCAPPGQMVYVADSSNIEARMLAWEASQEDLLEIFRTGGDVYAYTAQDIYNRPIDKKKDPHERFVGKVTALGLGYGMGWRKFKDTLAAGALGGPPVFMEDHEVQHIVNTFRTKRWAIKNYWQQADQAIVDMYMGNSRQWGPLTIHRNCIVMPNGMALQYPGLRPAEDDEFGGWEYHNGQFFTKIYGGKLCLAKGTQVLTREGWTKIEDVAPNTEVWDGIEWVKCDGSVYNGDKLVIELAGVTMTPDHEVLTDEGWKTASQSQGHNRAESRLPDGDGVRWERWEEIPVVGHMRLRQHQDVGGNRADQDAEARDFGLLRLQEIGEHCAQSDHARDVEASSIRRMAVDDRPLHPADAPSLEQLWGARDQGLSSLEGVVRGVLGGHGADLRTGPDAGPQRQQPALHAGELPLGNVQHPGQQPQEQRADQRQDDQAALDGIGDRAIDPVVSPEPWLALGQAATPDQAVQPIYDLINCGPRNRFVVRDGNGNPMIVHNCENITQALARIVLFDQMLAINELFEPHGGRVVMNVHDEIIAIGPDLGVDEADNELFQQMLTIMRTAPRWCPDLPLDGEGGVAAEYSK